MASGSFPLLFWIGALVGIELDSGLGGDSLVLYVGTGPIGVMTFPPYTGGLLGPTTTESSIFVSWSILRCDPGSVFPAASA